MKRTGFIGGSDCVQIMQGKWLELWQVKTGRAESEDLSNNIAVQLGSWTESFNLSWFEKEFKCILKNHQYEYEKQIGSVPAKGTIDAMHNAEVVEAKHTNNFNTMDKLTEYYMPQIQLYAHLAKADGIYLSVIFGNSKWESAYVSYNDKYFDSMWAVVSDFWSYVVGDTEPVGIQIPPLSIDKIEVDQMVRRDASKDNAFIAAAYDYADTEAAAKRFAQAKDDLKQMVKDNEREVYCDLLTVKRAKNGSLRITTRKV